VETTSKLGIGFQQNAEQQKEQRSAQHGRVKFTLTLTDALGSRHFTTRRGEPTLRVEGAGMEVTVKQTNNIAFGGKIGGSTGGGISSGLELALGLGSE
jgi:hypothetical protein